MGFGKIHKGKFGISYKITYPCQGGHDLPVLEVGDEGSSDTAEVEPGNEYLPVIGQHRSRDLNTDL